MSAAPQLQDYQRVIKARLADIREEEVQRFIQNPRPGMSPKRRRFLEALKEEMED